MNLLREIGGELAVLPLHKRIAWFLVLVVVAAVVFVLFVLAALYPLAEAGIL